VTIARERIKQDLAALIASEEVQGLKTLDGSKMGRTKAKYVGCTQAFGCSKDSTGKCKGQFGRLLGGAGHYTTPDGHRAVLESLDRRSTDSVLVVYDTLGSDVGVEKAFLVDESDGAKNAFFRF